MRLRYLFDRARMRWRVNITDNRMISDPPWWLGVLQGLALGLSAMAILVCVAVLMVVLLH